ncbi:MAG: acyl-CoA dehydrogenase family protein, partial [bacterium]
ISFLLIDMKTPGITIRPIDQIDGLSAFYETFFDNVEVPVENMVGEINEGWGMAKALLAHERSGTGANVDVKGLVGNIKTLARDYEKDGRPVLEDESFRQRLAQLEMDADGLLYTRYRMLTALLQGRAPGPEASIFKLYQSEVCQELYELALEAMGPDAARWYDKNLAPEAFEMPMQMTITRAMSIYSGSNEIQRNIIAKRVLNLPD